MTPLRLVPAPVARVIRPCVAVTLWKSRALSAQYIHTAARRCVVLWFGCREVAVRLPR